MKTIDIEGDKFYLNDNGYLNREDGPAIEYLSGEKFWFNNGEPHRDDGAAFIGKDGKEYWLFGKKAVGDEIKNIKRNKLFNDILDQDGWTFINL